MPGFCVSEPYGFTDLSTDIIMFDQALSKALVAVKDFRVSEMSVDGGPSSGETASAEVDPADTTSTVLWDYALNLMKAEDISQVVAELPSHERLTEVFISRVPFQLVLWQHPTV